MRIIPVIDLKEGQVVRAVAGRRETYRPVASVLARDASPASIATAFADRLGFREAYLADLDAIAGAEPAWTDYERVVSGGLRVWVDAGVATSLRARQLAEFDCRGTPLFRVIVGLESIAGPEELGEVIGTVGVDRLAFSLDLHQGRALTRSPGWRDLTNEKIAETVCAAGIQRLIVLDLARVGVGQGTGTESLCHRLHQAHPGVELVTGGGVVEVSQFRNLRRAGCSAVLVGSALHDGRLGAEQLRAAGLL